MNRTVISLGLFCGFLAGVILLILNPWIPEPASAGASANKYAWTPLEFYGTPLDQVSLLNIPIERTGNTLNDNLASANASIIVLRGTGGEAVALGTRLSAVDEASEMLKGDVGVNTYTNLFWPNRGSVLLAGHENRWPVIRSSILGFLSLSNDTSWPVTTYRRSGAPSGAVGGSGTLESIGGRHTETLHLSTDGDGSYTGELALELALR